MNTIKLCTFFGTHCTSFQTIVDAVQCATVATKWLNKNGHVFTQNITLPPVVHQTETDICDWAARTTAAGRSYIDVRDSIMFDTHSMSDIRLFLSLLSGGLHLPVNVCLNGQEFLANNSDPDLASW